jgi:HD-like signal output (HDOD) protein
MSSNEASRGDSTADSSEAFDFVQALARELSNGRVQLPSFPEAALGVQRALAKQDVDDGDVLRAVGSEPALAVRVLQMANSIALNPLGKPVTELRSAILRVGHNMVRTAAIAFVMQQLRRADEFKHLKQALQQLWLRSVSVGSVSMVVARRFTQVNPDSALLAGVLHGVGKLYILTRASRHPRLLSDRATFDQIVRDWHGGIARALLENWEMNDELIAAVQDHEDLERDMRGPVGLTDVLSVGSQLATYAERPGSGAEAEARLSDMEQRAARVWQRVRIDRAGCEAAVAEADEELAALRHILG